MGMSAGSAGGGSKAVPFINVTPLIDVLLVLLIIFMVITPLKPSRFKALVPEEPDPNQTEVLPNPLTLVVTIDNDLKLKLNTDEIGSVNDTGKLSSRLAQLFDQRRQDRAYKSGMEGRTDLPEEDRIEKGVFIKAPRSLNYGEVVKVIDSIKGAGANPVGLQVDDLAQ
ncbi:MAG: biopolymer transporter ExbD [Pyrinomonadaceae bacterium]|jgi:biopolymer transport protein ExbD|nr:biopolymer transporter ExbD [Pyrinomonadaceae bacterium]